MWWAVGHSHFQPSKRSSHFVVGNIKMLSLCLRFPGSILVSIVLWLSVLVHAAVEEDEILCRVSLIAEAVQHDRARTSFVCDTLNNNNEKTPRSVLFDPAKDLLQENSDSLLNNEWYISFPASWISTKNLPAPFIDIPYGEQVTTVNMDRRLPKKRLRRTSKTINRRTNTKPEESVLVVLVSAQDASPGFTTSQADDIMFGSSSNGISAASQLAACSFGQLQVEKYESGIIQVTVDDNINQYDKNSIRRAAEEKVCEHFGRSSSCDPGDDEGIDHVAYVIPFGLSSDPTYSNGFAYAGVGGTHSVFQGPAYAPQVIMHEIGHNWRLGHAGEANSEYGDTTGQVGQES